MIKTSLSEPGVKNNLKQLKEKGIIERIGSKKTGYT
jgi:DNA-binding Lrp family transcriptional regulator